MAEKIDPIKKSKGNDNDEDLDKDTDEFVKDSTNTSSQDDNDSLYSDNEEGETIKTVLGDVLPTVPPEEDELENMKIILLKCAEDIASDPKKTRAFDTMYTLLGMLRNVKREPEEEKYRSIRKKNKAFSQRVWWSQQAQQFLQAAGWQELDDSVTLMPDLGERRIDPAIDALSVSLSLHMAEHPKCSPHRLGLLGLSPLHIACAQDNVEIITMLLNAQVGHINDRNGNGMTPLHLAKDLDVIIKLVENGADINAQNEVGSTPLHCFLERELFDQASYLIDQPGCDINAKETDGATPLAKAVAVGGAVILQKLIERGCNINVCTKDQVYPIHFAAHFGHTRVAEMLINNKCDLDAKTSDTRTPLYLAVDEDHAQIVKLLINGGCDINAKHAKGVTALHLAAHKRNARCASLLISNPTCDINALETTYGTSPLFAAAQNGSVEIVTDLVKTGRCNVNLQDKDDHWTALFVAAKNGHVNVVRVLVDAGAKDLPGKNGHTALHISSLKGNAEIVELLLACNEMDEDENDDSSDVQEPPDTMEDLYGAEAEADSDQAQDEEDDTQSQLRGLMAELMSQLGDLAGSLDLGQILSQVQGGDDPEVRQLGQLLQQMNVGASVNPSAAAQEPSQNPLPEPADKELSTGLLDSNPHSLSGLKETMAEKELRNIIKVVSTELDPKEVRPLASCLGVPAEVINAVYSENEPRFGVVECAYQCLHKWLQRRKPDSPATKQYLVEQLRQVGRHDLAERYASPMEGDEDGACGGIPEYGEGKGKP
ncbi:uncharacterized protein LOC144911164 [Branchiostoma floridae x Branchiostoma belcheri]